ncbi:hypothetical protein RIF29_41986 [Crotalaria pallida]|uniref:Uncharacterized protein n=1 Tax=Crotalaria pallida TaxID=3830 RepID=A0AAN9HS08_CROPI
MYSSSSLPHKLGLLSLFHFSLPRLLSFPLLLHSSKQSLPPSRFHHQTRAFQFWPSKTSNPCSKGVACSSNLASQHQFCVLETYLGF